MQVSATLIAAQQAAREAQARFQQVHAPALQQANFASALTGTAKTAETAKMVEPAKTDGFSPLPFKQTAPAPAASAAADAKPARLGTLLDIRI